MLVRAKATRLTLHEVEPYRLRRLPQERLATCGVACIIVRAQALQRLLHPSTEAAEDPLPYLTGHRADAPTVDWDELTRGQG